MSCDVYPTHWLCVYLIFVEVVLGVHVLIQCSHALSRMLLVRNIVLSESKQASSWSSREQVALREGSHTFRALGCCGGSADELHVCSVWAHPWARSSWSGSLQQEDIVWFYVIRKRFYSNLWIIALVNWSSVWSMKRRRMVKEYANHNFTKPTGASSDFLFILTNSPKSSLYTQRHRKLVHIHI